ncbi:hypothetical protein J6590_087780 [Homalodisca vitripennis]|nr:hypothetical protein J6590_087780 [Homalodisca vitripennis]
MSRRPWTDHIDRLQHRITSCYICKRHYSACKKQRAKKKVMSRRPWTDHIDRLQHRITSCYICNVSPYTLTMAEITSKLQLTMYQRHYSACKKQRAKDYVASAVD